MPKVALFQDVRVKRRIGTVNQPGIVCLFAKEPRPGVAKTRLGKSLGSQRAAALAQAFLSDTIDLVSSLPDCRSVAAVTPDDFHVPRVQECWPQGGGDLGNRLERAAMRALQQGPWVLFVGSDSPGLPREFLVRATSWLSEPGGPDAVLGPADDGGYYALGLRRVTALTGVRWSSEHALADTEAALQSAGSSSRLLDSWFDVDDVDDLWRLSRLLSEGSAEAPHTKLELAQLRL